MFWKKKNILIVLGLALAPIASVVIADHMLGTPTNIGWGTSPSISTDGLSLYVDSYERSGGYGGYDIWVYTRETIHDDWSGPDNAGPPINSTYKESNPYIWADGLTFSFDTDWPEGPGGDLDIWLTTRVAKDEPWSEPVILTINSPYYDGHSSVTSDGLWLFFCSDRPGGEGDRDIWFSTRATTDDPWSEPENLGPIVNSPSNDIGPDISSDGLTLFFDSERPGGYGLKDIWVTTRKTKDDDWGVPVNLGPVVNTSNNDITPYISADGSTLYFYSNGSLKQVPIIPLVDLNGSGFFDIDDLVIIIKNWDTNEPSCDIGPAPFGNGIVDKKDLEVFMNYWEQEVNDPALIAYWPLDETEGSKAQEKVANESGYVFGEPVWQPDGGMVNGALELDGIDDLVFTDFNFNPASGPFSVFAWIKDGLQYQTIISQEEGANWLSAERLDGYLMTELKSEGIDASELVSQTVIIDGNWHRVGLVWDGTNRMLYVDDEVVAQDTQDNLSGSEGNLLIGTGNNMEIGTFWTGLIDDVRIYNRAITP